MTATFDPVTIPEGSYTSTLMLTATADAIPREAEYTVTARASGVREVSAIGQMSIEVPPPPPPPPFNLVVDPAAVSIATGSTGQATIGVLRRSPHVEGSVVLLARGLPPGVEASFEPSSFYLSTGARPGRSTLTLTVNAGVAAGNYSITIGTAGSASRSAVLTLTVP